MQVGSNGNYVYVIDTDNIVAIRPVTVTLSTGAVSVISDGLKGGEKVVVDGIDTLKDKAKVNIVATVETVSMAQHSSPLTTESSARKVTGKAKEPSDKAKAGQ